MKSTNPRSMPAFQAGEVTDFEERHEIERFLIREAAYADRSDYEAWEALLEPDMIYWVPRGFGDFDPDIDISIINDNRSRITTRLRQLKTGSRHAQTPPSPMRRLISNLVITRTSPDEYDVESNFALYEMPVQTRTMGINVWAGSVEHKLRRTENGLRMFFKKVMLVNGAQPLPTMAFIL